MVSNKIVINNKIALYNVDCTKVLKRLKDDCAAAVITSPPYNMNLRIRNNKFVSRQITK